MRLIDADELMNFCNNLRDKTIDANDIARFPTVDAVPVRHGRWVKGELAPDSWQFCSICRFPKAVRRAQWYYCPSCGAKMDEGEEDA